MRVRLCAYAQLFAREWSNVAGRREHVSMRFLFYVILSKIIISLQRVYFHQMVAKPTQLHCWNHKNHRHAVRAIMIPMLREFYVLNGVVSSTFQAAYLGHRQSACGNLHIDKGIDYITITTPKSKLLRHLNMQLSAFIFVPNIHRYQQKSQLCYRKAQESACEMKNPAVHVFYQQRVTKSLTGLGGMLTSLQTKALLWQDLHLHTHTCTI